MDNQFTFGGLLFIVCLIVPGVIFKRFYFQGQFSKQFGAGLFADRVITSIFWGIIVQIFTYLITSKSFDFSYGDILKRAQPAVKDINQNIIPTFDHKEIPQVLLYLLSSLIIASILGIVIHQIIVLLKLDIRFKVLRFENEWHYYFTGRILHSSDFRDFKPGKILSINVDVMIDDGSDKAKLISGYLKQYSLSTKTGQLELICLTSAKRFSKDKKVFVDIPGDCVMISCDKLIDINLKYNMAVPVPINKERTSKVIFVFGFILVVGSAFFPWFLDISVARKLVASVSSFISIIWLMVVILHPLEQRQDSKIKLDLMWFCFFMFLIFAGVALEAFFYW